MTTKDVLYEKLANAVVTGNEESCTQFANEVLENGFDAYEAIMEGCTAGMSIVSDKYDKKELYVPHILLSARAMQAAVDILQPHIIMDASVIPGKVVMGVVHGDIHDIGISIVNTLLKAAGFDVHYIGKDIPPEQFIDKAKEVNADVIGLSALMTPSMMGMGEVVGLVKQNIPETKIMIGGGPVSQHFCDNIGADAYAENAPQAVEVVDSLIKAKEV